MTKHTHDSMLGIFYMILFPHYSSLHVVTLENVWIDSSIGLDLNLKALSFNLAAWVSCLMGEGKKCLLV